MKAIGFGKSSKAVVGIEIIESKNLRTNFVLFISLLALSLMLLNDREVFGLHVLHGRKYLN